MSFISNTAAKLGFKDNKVLAGFLSVVLSGQLIYSGFEAFKATFYTSLIEVLGVSNTEMGILFTLIGSAMFFYIPAGWVNTRFAPRQLLIFGLIVRLIGMSYIILSPTTHFIPLAIIAASWGVTDAIFWPAVLNGVRQFASDDKQGMAFGLLESIRRFAEMAMNAAVLMAMTLLGATALVFKGMMGFYTALIVLVIIAIWKYVPDNRSFNPEATNKEKNKEALTGLLKVLKMPEIWMIGIVAMCVYWCYINLVYSVPYMETVFGLSKSQAAIFGLLNASAMGVIGGLISGTLADFIFKSATRMLFYSMILMAVALCGVLMLPMTVAMVTANILLLALFSFTVFLCRSVFFAPIGELGIPKEVSGAAMSIGSFLAYTPVFWAYAINGWILDQYEPTVAYQKIFMIGAIVAVVGCLAAFVLLLKVNAKRRKEQTSQCQVAMGQ